MGSKYPKWDPNAPNGIQIPQMGSNCPIWDPTAPYGVQPPHMGSKYPPMGSNRPIWDPTAPYGVHAMSCGVGWGSHFPPPPLHPIPRRCGAASVWGGAALWGAAPPASVVNWGGSWLIRAVNEAAGEAGRLPRVWDGPRPGQSDWEGLGGTGRERGVPQSP